MEGVDEHSTFGPGSSVTRRDNMGLDGMNRYEVHDRDIIFPFNLSQAHCKIWPDLIPVID